MTGPEHYLEAERLIDAATNPATIARSGLQSEATDEGRARNLAAAQVHATLALAAATALSVPEQDPQGNVNTPLICAWDEAGAW